MNNETIVLKLIAMQILASVVIAIMLYAFNGKADMKNSGENNINKNDIENVSPGLRMNIGATSIKLPLVETKVRGEIEGFVAKVSVIQTFVNPFDDYIEATYVFPLPETAAVNNMIMYLDGREIVAKIKIKEEAQQIYKQAVSTGKTASLLNQERPNIFTQKVGNIPPGDTIKVELTYVEILTYEKGVSSFAFPTVVGPRYIPGQPLNCMDSELFKISHNTTRTKGTTQVPDASLITPLTFDEEETGNHLINLEFVINPGLPIKKIESPSHALDIVHISKNEAVVRLAQGDNIPNKDFILKIDLRSTNPQIAILTHREENEDGYLTMAIQPPAFSASDQITPKDLFFVVDNSGSMYGQPLDAAKALVIEALKNMNPQDRFTIMRFSDEVSALSTVPLDNNARNVAAGIKFIKDMEGMGGTEMLSGIRRALKGKTEHDRVRIVFFLTDGYIGNDDEILAAVKNENQSDARLFSMGVGSSVNRYLLSSMARLGRGEMQVMGHNQDIKPFVKKFYKRVRNPVLTNISLKWNGLEISDQTPAILPDLFDGQPLIVHARYDKPGKGELLITGNLGNQTFKQKIKVKLPEKSYKPAVSNLWARAMISQWSDEETARPGVRRDDIITVALTHNLMSQYTSFVAVDKTVVRSSNKPLIPVAQRILLPKGVSNRSIGQLSRYAIPPGDPFISIWAPPNAIRVTAFFQFGLIKDLTYDEGRDKWRGRFLVPAGILDGYYKIIIAIQTADGQLSYRSEIYHLDSEAEEFITNFDITRVRAGRGVLLKVDSIEKADEVYVYCQELGIDRVLLNPTDSDIFVNWKTFLKIAKDTPAGQYYFLVVVRDDAGNRLEKELIVNVYSETE